MARVNVRCWQETYRGLVSDAVLDDPGFLAARERFWTAALTDERYRENRVAVAERDGELVGIAMSGPPLDAAAAWARQLYVLYVYAADHGTGAGPALLEAVVDPEESAALWVADPNPRAQAFYRKHGFVADGTAQVEDGVREIRMVRGGEALDICSTCLGGCTRFGDPGEMMRPEFQDLVDEVSHLLERPATLEDRDFNLVAFCSHEAQVDEVRLRSIMRRHSTREVRDWFEQFGIATSDVPVRTPASPDLEVLSRLCLPVRWHGVTYGYLWLLDEHATIDAERVPAAAALVERAGALMAQQARSREELAHTVEDLLSRDPEAAARAAESIHELGIVALHGPVAALELRLVTTAGGSRYR